jgi:hypothetical protein
MGKDLEQVKYFGCGMKPGLEKHVSLAVDGQRIQVQRLNMNDVNILLR